MSEILRSTPELTRERTWYTVLFEFDDPRLVEVAKHHLGNNLRDAFREYTPAENWLDSHWEYQRQPGSEAALFKAAARMFDEPVPLHEVTTNAVWHMIDWLHDNELADAIVTDVRIIAERSEAPLPAVAALEFDAQDVAADLIHSATQLQLAFA